MKQILRCREQIPSIRLIGLWVWIFCFTTGLLPTKNTIFPILNNGWMSSAFAAESLAPAWPQEHSDLSPDPTLIFGKLSNGFRYVLMPNQTPQNRVSMHLVVHAGSLNETDAQQGLAHFLEHLEYCGSTHFKPGALIKYFQRIGMDFGADANAQTGFTHTVYDMLLPDGSRKSLAEGLTVLRDFAGGALLLPSEINRERKVVLAEKMTRDSASYRTFVSTIRFALPDSLISKRFPIGKKEIVQNAGQKEIKQFYDAWYRPENMTLVVVGDMKPETAKILIERDFRSLSARAKKASAPGMGVVDNHGVKAFYHYEAESGAASVSIGMMYSRKHRPDSIQLQKEETVRTLADQIIQNRLDALLRKPGTPFTAAGVHSGRFVDGVHMAEISAQCDPQNWKASLSAMEQQLRSALEYGFSETEVARAKSDYLAWLDDAASKAATRNSQTLASGLISDVENDRVTQSPKQQKELLSPFIQSLSANDIHNALKALWGQHDQRLIELTGNVRLEAAGGVSPEQQILSAWQDSQKIMVAAPVEYKAVAFPYLSVPDTPGKIVHQDDISDLGIVRVEFANGVRLNLKKTDFKKNQIVAEATFGAGSASEPADKPGLNYLTSEVIRESGLGKLTREELDRALAGKNTEIGFKVGENQFTLEAASAPNELELMFQLLYAYMVDPGFRPEAYTLCMERYAQQYQELSRSVNGVAMLRAMRFWGGGDTRLGLPTYDEYKKLTINDVTSWILPAIQHSALEISIAGDMDIPAVIHLAARYMGNLPQRSTDFTQPKPASPQFPDGANLTLPVDTHIPKSLVMMAYPTDDFWNIQRTRRLSVLGEVFSDRLRRNIRVKLGAAYAPAAFNMPSRAYPGYGLFQTIITVNPDDAGKVIQEVKSIAAALSEKTISPDELHRTLDPMLTGIKDLVRTNDYWLNSVMAGSSRYPQQIDWCRSFQKDYTAISAEDIHQLAIQYLNNRKLSVIQILPEKLSQNSKTAPPPAK